MRPRVICHMMGSVDGKLHPSRYSRPRGIARETLGGHYDQTAETFGADGWMVGRVTMAEIVKDERAPSLGGVGPRVAWSNPARGTSVAVAVDPDGKLHYTKSKVGEDHLVAVLGEHVSDAYLAQLRAAGVSFVFAGADGHDLAAGMEALGALGLKVILLEGGASINAAFLAAGLIDEISLLIFPGIDGVGGIQTLFEGPETDVPGYGRALAFKSAEVLDGGMVWLRYDVDPDGLGN